MVAAACAVVLVQLASVGQAHAASGSITGHVDDDLGTPVEGALVKVYEISNTKVAAVLPVHTDAAGDYHLDGLPTGSYVVMVNGDVVHATQWWDHVPTRDLATPIAVTDGAITPSVDFDLLDAPVPTAPMVLASTKAVSVPRGRRVEISIKGSGLSPLVSVSLTGNGINRLLVKEGSTDVKARVAILLAASATKGMRTLTLVRSDGATKDVAIKVG
jgi:hypothetical protein